MASRFSGLMIKRLSRYGCPEQMVPHLQAFTKNIFFATDMRSMSEVHLCQKLFKSVEKASWPEVPA